MRVLFVVPWDQAVGGVASVVGNLARDLEERGHGVVFLHPGSTDVLVPSVTKWGFSGHRLRLRGPFAPDRPVRSLVAFWVLLLPTLVRLVGFLKRERIDVVNLHYPLGSFLSVVLAARLIGRPVVTSVHGADLFPGGEPLPRYPLALRALLRLSQRIVAPSRSYLDQVTKRLPVLARHATFIHNGIRMAEFSHESPGPAADHRYVLTIAAHNRKKGLDVLLEGFSRIAGRHPDVRLLLLGDGPLRSRLEELTERLAMTDRVEFLGTRERAETVELLRGCEVFVLPSRAEPFGLAVLEALACGSPVVATRVGGIREIVREGLDGLLVEPDDPAALAAAIERVLTEPGGGRRRAIEGLGQARRFSTEANACRYEALFAGLIDGERAG